MPGKPFNAAIISIYPFPQGMATTNRILAYSKGLSINGAKVNIFNPFPTDQYREEGRIQNTGTFDGISYNFTSGRYLSKSRWTRGLIRVSGIKRVYGYITSFIEISREHKKSRFDCLIISTDEIRSLFVYSFLASYLKIPSVFIFDEYPTPIRHKLKNSIPWWKEFFYKCSLKNISAYISISEELKNYFCNISNKPSFILSVIVDTSRFSEKMIMTVQDSIDEKYLCYMGNLELTKDDVDNIVKAFAIVIKKHKNLTLRLYGPKLANTMTIIGELIDNLGLGNKVKFMGKVESKDVPSILKQAYILVSSQPDTKRASGGFPTKLGEYLSTGVPAIFTDVGENSRYITRNEHAFFVKPGDHLEYADKLLFIIDNYNLALSIAQKGKEYIQHNYSHATKGMEMLNFLKSLK